MENLTEEKPILNKKLIIKMASCLGLALYFVIFMWGIGSREVFALGLNAFVFIIMILYLFLRAIFEEKNYSRRDLVWTIPLFLIALSYLVYDNPFIKIVNMPVYTALTALFILYGQLKDKEKRPWNLNFVSRLLSRLFSMFLKVGEAINNYVDLLVPKSKRGRGTVRKTILGLILFLAIALTIVIPFLSSADTEFGAKMDFIYNWLDRVISQTFFNKLIVFAVLSIAILSALLAWGKRHDYAEREETERKVDSIVAGIVLGGILGLYLLFLWVQVARLWVGSLPFDFKETEDLVKSGFWQLFFLTGLNVLIYFFTYRRTGPVVQKILIAFTAASFLLLASAGYRMALYVIYYGFSYEKFFASYTVLYSAILFIWLLSRLFITKRANIFKFLVFLFLWMFAVITIVPVEQFIFRANLALAKRPDSRISIYELTMLSPDVLNLVKAKQAEGTLTTKKRNAETGAMEIKQSDWQPWIEQQEKRLADKKWYEKNLRNLISQ